MPDRTEDLRRLAEWLGWTVTTNARGVSRAEDPLTALLSDAVMRTEQD